MSDSGFSSTPQGQRLRRSVEDAVLNVAARPPELRGPWLFDDAQLRRQAKAIKQRRATRSEAEMRDLLEPLQPTVEEAQAIRALKRLARRWPRQLWLFSAAGSLHVMKADEQGRHHYRSDQSVDPSFSLATVDIPNDGGDW